MPIAETSLVTAATKAGTAALFKAASERLEKTLKGPAKALGIRALAALQGYSSYLAETNERVSTFKTFADPTKPVSVLDHFVETRFSLLRSNRVINQDDMLARLKRPSRIVISATAGFGKSMVMRYLALALFENPMGKIPVFLELRNLNRISSPDIVTFINNSYRQVSAIQVESFRQGLSSGAFVLILDGFDELNHDLRPIIEDQILNLVRTYPALSIVVSGRPDDRFKSWRAFSLFKIQPMKEPQVIDLLNKLEYDKGVRKRFIQKIRGGLFESHESFMSTPLLAILMLLTFEQNANIPDKMHLFYGEAFRTLFHKHDALKEQYDRSRKSGLAVDEFEKVFAVFCLKTYVLEKLEFTPTEIVKNINDALSYEQSDTKAVDFLFDIEEAVCLFVKEGNSYFFVHRSFQEYFTAVFLSTCAESIRDEFIEQVSSRYWDNVLPMLFDMAGDQIAPTWVASNSERYLKNVGYTDGVINPLMARFKEIKFYKKGASIHVNTFVFGEYWKFVAVMMRFYPEVNTGNLIDFGPIERWVAANFSKVGTNVNSRYTDPDGLEVVYFQVPIDDIPEELLVKSGFRNMADSEFSAITKVEANLNKEQKAKSAFLEKLFAKPS